MLHRLIHRQPRVAKVISATKIGDVRPLKRPEGMTVKHSGQFRQIQIHEEQAILKMIGRWPEPAMSNGALVNAAMHALSLLK
jgi:glutamate synthase domain-containing protein 2